MLKSDKTSVRICGDFKLTVNQVSKLDRYPIPKIEDLFAQLAGGKSFTKLDLSQAYQQLSGCRIKAVCHHQHPQGVVSV